MRKASRVDGNQFEIVKALRNIGATVTPLHAVGGGMPDLAVGYRGRNYLLEVKDPMRQEKAYRERNTAKALTEDQKEWFFYWQGQCCVVWDVAEAIEIITR